jgi:hypothetical protein
VAASDPVVRELCLLHGEDDPEALILRLCRDLLRVHPTDRGPTPLKVLGSVRLIRAVLVRSMPEGMACSSLLVERDGGYQILIEEADTPGRQRWSLAHEIVHTFFRELDHGGASSEEQEALCDLGAAELTMPADRFSPRLESLGLSLAGIRDLTSEFEMSFVATGRRAAQLTAQEACFLTAQPREGDHTPEVSVSPLRIEHWTASAHWSADLDLEAAKFVEGGVLSEAFSFGVERSGVEQLDCGGTKRSFAIEAIGYSYLRRATEHRTVAALLLGMT